MKISVLIDMIFSPEWYLERYPDVRGYTDGPKVHYLTRGWQEGRSPHPLFETSWYLAQSLDVTDLGLEPVTHYFETGWRALRSPHPLFNPAWYLLKHDDILAADIDPLLHYIQHGWREGRSLHPLFDTRWYLSKYPDVAAQGVDPLTHYLQFGWREDRAPHPLFDPVWYKTTYPDTTGVNPWRHYLEHGWQEGRSPHPLFDAKWYQATYLDPILQECEPLAHYLEHGWQEGLWPAADAQAMAQSSQPSDMAAPLYLNLTAAELDPVKRAGASAQLREDGRRGRLLLVTHDTQLGGAQKVLKLFADWVVRSTRFSVGIVAINGGHFRYEFEAVAPVFVLSDYPEESRADALAAWAGDDVQAIFVNSIASGSFYQYWSRPTPSVAFIHELPKILDLYPQEVALVRDRASHVIGGGPDVTKALRDQYGFGADRLSSSFSFIEAAAANDTEAKRQARQQAARKELAVAQDRLVVMGCGVLHWRKSPDKFVETAERVLAAGVDAEFIWLGGGPDQDACEAMARNKGIADRVRFTGYEPDVAGKLAAADIFLLSSQEDPFPLVALYAAQAGAPVVCFEDAGGIAAFVKAGSGTAVPFMDVVAMADAVTALARDGERRRAKGAVGIEQVRRSHTIDVAGPLLLHHLRHVAKLAPEVSVVMPNFNYELYLPQRLASIASQRFQDFEIILLDDASSDRSAEILADFATTRPGTRVVVNSENSGSPFVQWIKGMEMAAADLIWLAEADDYCEDELLATLLPFFDDRNMRIASCASVPVDSNGGLIGDYRPLYLDRITPGRWNKDFVATDHEEANDGLGIANTIPNASAVIFRRFTPEPEFVSEVTSMRLCGDWYFYTRVMRGGLVGFSATAMNYHRRHGGTVTHRLEGSMRYFNELAAVRAYLGRTYQQNRLALDRIAGFLAQDIARFHVPDPEALPKAPVAGKSLPSLAVIVPDLSPGGGQIFAISLANEWARRGGRVVLINAKTQPTHPAVLKKVDPIVTLLHAGDPGAALDTVVRRYDIDVIHSSIWWADITVDSYCERLPKELPWVISMHGCHETIIAQPDIDLQFKARVSRMIGRANAWAYTAEKNLRVFDIYGRPERLLRIPNGMREDPVQTRLDRTALGLRPDATVLCLASRAIESKGWLEAVAVTKALNAEGHKVDLMLIGEGPAADTIRASAPAHVHLMGQVANLQDYFLIADVGLLPSYFVGESLPLVLLEMMAKGLPLVASTIGEIPRIIGKGAAAGGLLVPLAKGGLDRAAFLDATRRMLDASLRQQFGTNARARFDADFRLDRMVDRYTALYEEVGARVWKAAEV